MAVKDPKVALMRSVDAFEGISDRDLGRMSPMFDEITLEPGDTLMQQGRFGHEAFVIIEGSAVVTKARKRVATLGPGDFVGEMAVIDRGRRSATVKAETRLRMLAITAANFNALMDIPDVQIAVGAMMAGRLRRSEGAPQRVPGELVAEAPRPVRPRNGRKRRLIAAALAAVVVIGGGSFYVVGKRATPVTVDEAVSRFRSAEAVVPELASEVAGDEQSAGGDAGSGDDVVTGSVAGPAEKVGASRPAAVPAGDAAGLAEGVYVYDTSGFEEVSVLGGARHAYPSETTITVERTACGADVRWDGLAERWDKWTTCDKGTGIDLREFVTYHEFFKQVDEKRYECPKGAMLRPGSDKAGTKTSGTCDSEEARVVINAAVVGVEKVTVDGDAMKAVHVRVDETLTGATRGTRRVDSWYAPATGLLLRRNALTEVDSKSAFGFTHYREEFEIKISSLEPLR